jgi:ribosomal protein S18 acetylase RimI-like enzyme
MIRVGTIEEAHKIFMVIPELDRYLSLSEMKEKLVGTHLVSIAENQGTLIGFKLGYQISEDEFYSWLGAVIPAYRNSGVAQSLLDFQEGWVIKSGFKSISVKSMNRFPSMLRLLIKNGYRIKSVENFDDAKKERIGFIKRL